MHEIDVSVSCLHVSSGPELMYLAARRCTAKEEGSVRFLEANNPENKAEVARIVHECLESGHESILEHVSLSFHIQCSRACSLQFMRHRLASYAQQSQRYVDMSELPFVMPELKYLGEKKDKAELVFWRHMRNVENAYKELRELGVKKEDARGVLPEMTGTQFVTTMNCRELLNFFRLRTCNRAQGEIRELANRMLEYCQYYLPEVFEDAGPKCKFLGVCIEPKSCGKAPQRGREHDAA